MEKQHLEEEGGMLGRVHCHLPNGGWILSVNPILGTVSPTGEVQHVFFLQFNMDTVNPLLSPPGGLFFSSTFEGGLNREGGLILLSETHHL